MMRNLTEDEKKRSIERAYAAYIPPDPKFESAEERLSRQVSDYAVCPSCQKIADNFGWPQFGNGVHLKGCEKGVRA